MELKYPYDIDARPTPEGSNRTFMELKYHTETTVLVVRGF